MQFLKKRTYLLMAATLVMGMSACTGLFDGIYDDPNRAPQAKPNQLLVDASDWHNWYYIDFDSLQMLAESGDADASLHARTHFTPYPIPLVKQENAGQSTTGIYTFWFDVFGKGLSNNEQRDFTPTAPQPEPPSWSIAIHRDNVRTNGGTVLETNYTSMSQLPASSVTFMGATFKPDEFTANEVWADQSQMLNSLIGCQGISINRTLSSWLRLEIPPMPPAFVLNNHVFIVKFSNGKCAALQLENYINPATGAKSFLTINYRYPY